LFVLFAANNNKKKKKKIHNVLIVKH